MAETNTGGGANVGGDASAGRNLSGRDMTSVEVSGSASGIAVGAGNNVSIHHSDRPLDDFSDRELLRKISVALLGDPYNRRGNPGLVETVDELLDKFASLVAANAAQSVRLDNADKERGQISKNQQSLIDAQSQFRLDSEERFKAIDSTQTATAVLVWLIAAFLIGEGAYLVYLSLRLLPGS